MMPLFKPYVPDTLLELENILHSGQLAYGKYAMEFERSLAEYIGIGQVICTNSFNSAYLVLIKALNLQSGDEVVASPLCCLASSQPFAVSGVKLVWADIDPATGTLDPDSVRNSITNNTKAILHNHFCGYVGHIEEISSIAKEKGLLLIDDASEAFGSEYNGKKAGNWGADATIYSFQTVRLPNAVDGGGMSFMSEEHYKRAELLRDYGIDRPHFRDELGEIYAGCDISLPAYGCMPTDMNGYIGSLSLQETPRLLEYQRNNARIIASGLPEGVTPLEPLPGTNPNRWVFGAKVKDKRSFIARERARGRIGVSGVHLPNNCYSLFGAQKGLKGVEEFFSHFVALPCGWWITPRNFQ